MTTVPVTDITANYHGGNPFSVAAFEQTPSQRRERDLARIERSLDEEGDATCEQLEDRTGIKHQTCSARVSELKRRKRVEPAGTAPTRSGRSAQVHRLVKDEQGT